MYGLEAWTISKQSITKETGGNRNVSTENATNLMDCKDQTKQYYDKAIQQYHI